MTKITEKVYSQALMLVLFVNGLIWLRSAWGKVTEGKFVGSLGGTLTKFAGNNPYHWYKQLLTDLAIPNSITIGNLIMWSELAVAILISGSALYLLANPKANIKMGSLFFGLGLIGGITLNTMFWLAAGWTSPSTDGLNLLMLDTQLIGLVVIIRASLR